MERQLQTQRDAYFKLKDDVQSTRNKIAMSREIMNKANRHHKSDRCHACKVIIRGRKQRLKQLDDFNDNRLKRKYETGSDAGSVAYRSAVDYHGWFIKDRESEPNITPFESGFSISNAHLLEPSPFTNGTHKTLKQLKDLHSYAISTETGRHNLESQTINPLNPLIADRQAREAVSAGIRDRAVPVPDTVMRGREQSVTNPLMRALGRGSERQTPLSERSRLNPLMSGGGGGYGSLP